MNVEHKSEGSANFMQKQGQSSILCAVALLLSYLFQKTPATQNSAQDSHPSKVPQALFLFQFLLCLDLTSRNKKTTTIFEDSTTKCQAGQLRNSHRIPRGATRQRPVS